MRFLANPRVRENRRQVVEACILGADSSPEPIVRRELIERLAQPRAGVMFWWPIRPELSPCTGRRKWRETHDVPARRRR